MSTSHFDRIKKAFIKDIFGIPLLESIINEQQDSYVDEQPFVSSSIATNAYKRLSIDSSLEEMLQTAKQSASLGTYLRQKAHQRDMVTYRAALFGLAQISRDYWSRLLNDELKASKEKLLRVAVLLKFEVEEAEDLLTKGGYALSPTIPRDVVVQYCLSNEHYDFGIIEQLLEDYEIQSLFNDRRGQERNLG